MRKIFLTILILSLLLSLVGCGSEDPALVGTWEANVDLTDAMETYWQEQGVELKTEEKLYVQMELVFTADGGCSMYFDSQESQTLAESYFTAVLGELIELLYQTQEVEGMSREETDSFLASQGTTAEAMCQTLLEEPREIIGNVLSESEALRDGVYRTEDGKLYMEATEKDLKNAVDNMGYLLEGDTLTLNFEDGSLLDSEISALVFYRK